MSYTKGMVGYSKDMLVPPSVVHVKGANIADSVLATSLDIVKGDQVFIAYKQATEVGACAVNAGTVRIVTAVPGDTPYNQVMMMAFKDVLKGVKTGIARTKEESALLSILDVKVTEKYSDRDIEFC